MACREGTPRAPRSGQIQNRHCSVRATPFGGRGVRRSEDRLLKCWPERQNCITQLTREGSPAGFALLQAKLPRNSSQIARGRIRRFESYMPSHVVGSLWRFAEAVLRGRVDIERSLKIRSQEQRLRARTKTTLPTPGYYLKAQIRQGAGSESRPVGSEFEVPESWIEPTAGW